MKKLFLTAIFIFPLFSSSQIPALPQQRPIALVGGKIYTITKGIIENGIVIFENGKIKAVGKDIKIPENAEIINIQGKNVYPGLIDANSLIGLVEISTIKVTQDIREAGEFNPNIKPEVAINMESEIIPVTRANGVLISLVVPQGGIISGSSALIELDGWTWEDALLKAPVGIHLFWPSLKPFSYYFEVLPKKSKEELEKEYKDKILKIKKFFEESKAYLKLKESGKFYKKDERYEAMIPVLKKEIPLFIHADELKQIKDAIDFALNENLKIILVGGYDAWKVSDILKEKNIPVIITGIHVLPRRKWEGYDEPFTLPYKLYKSQVKFCIANSGNAFSTMNARNLPYKAANAIPFGLPEEEALKSITLYPAQILGIDERLGSIEEGKDATLIVTDGNILEIKTNILMAFIRGKKIDLSNKHKILYEKYTKKYEYLK
ncbi:MAG: amidohydrolase family protein [candidate division WOR-3 bacterium]